jgi:hypothetical protein
MADDSSSGQKQEIARFMKADKGNLAGPFLLKCVLTGHAG